MITADDKTEFKHRVEEWVHGAGFEIEEVRIRPMKNKWSSCSDNGRLSFSADLLTKSEDFQRDVVMREILSLRSSQGGRMSRVFMKAFGLVQSAVHVHSTSVFCQT